MSSGARARLAAALAMFACGTLVEAQLAITEIMSQSATNSGIPDYWELTNFGDTPINLTGYRVADRNGGDSASFIDLTIQAQESIVFILLNVGQTYTNFASVWGPEFSGRVIEQVGFSLSGNGEPLWLWDAQDRLVDFIEFPALPVIQRGVSFSFNPNTGRLNWLSQVGECGAFKAANSDDIGSPGRHHCGPVPLAVRGDLVSQTIDGGDSIQLTVDVDGLPRPRFRWFFENEPVLDGAVLNGTNATLTIGEVTPQHQGRYHVVATNFQGAVTSSVVLLQVNTNPACVSITSLTTPPELFEGQTATFSVASRGYPRRSYQWQHNGLDILGADGPTLAIENVSFDSSGIYSVLVSNEVCVASTAAVLRVTHRPDLRITEVMIDAGTNSPGKDYWELTNYDTNTIDITGYKFLDSLNWALAVPVTTRTLIRPGESVIFCDTLDSNAFIQWWGNLPPDLQIIPYRGVGLGPYQELHLWNAGGSRIDDFLTSATCGTNQCPGVSFRSAHGMRLDDCSVEGQDGAFRSALGDSIGSPGYDALPRILSTTVVSNEVRLRCLANPGEDYELQYNNSLAADGWSTAIGFTAPEFVFSLTNRVPPAAGTRFYRLRQ